MIQFEKEENQYYIAFGGSDKKELKRFLQEVIKELDSDYAKPVQKNVTIFGAEFQLITPMWNNELY